MELKPSVVRWNQHPVISTVLWILGTNETASLDPNDKNNNSNGKLNVLTWKDDHGGNINEYMLQVQSGGEAASSSRPNNMDEEVVLSPKVSQEDTVRNGEQQEDIQHADQYPSPQWGFYVPITPPQQEMHGKLKKDLVSIQAECRSKT